MLKSRRYKLMLLGIGLMALAAVPNLGNFTWVLLAAGWTLIIYTTIRRRF